MVPAFTVLMEVARKSWFLQHLPLQLGYPRNILGAIPTAASRKCLYGHIYRTILIEVSRYCMDADGNDVLIAKEATDESSEEESEHDHEESSSSSGQNCHFHAGVE